MRPQMSAGTTADAKDDLGNTVVPRMSQYCLRVRCHRSACSNKTPLELVGLSCCGLHYQGTNKQITTCLFTVVSVNNVEDGLNICRSCFPTNPDLATNLESKNLCQERNFLTIFLKNGPSILGFIFWKRLTSKGRTRHHFTIICPIIKKPPVCSLRILFCGILRNFW